MSKDDPPIGFEAVTISNAVIGFTSSTASPAGKNPYDYALVTVEDAAMRYRVDGGLPTTLLGHLTAAADVIELESETEIRNFKAIRSTGSDSKIMVTFKYTSELETV